jgi:hypothetical protein
MILASFMVPIPSLTVNHFILMSRFHWINSLPGVIAPQLIAPGSDVYPCIGFDSNTASFVSWDAPGLHAVMPGQARLVPAIHVVQPQTRVGALSTVSRRSI